MTNKPGFGAVAPILACNDVLATAHWYRDVLGFVIDDEWTGETWGMLWAEGSQVFLSLRPELVKTAKGQELLIAAPDVDAVYARHKANGAKIVSPLQTQPWGLREYTVEDPNGYHLRFQTSVGTGDGDSEPIPDGDYDNEGP